MSLLNRLSAKTAAPITTNRMSSGIRRRSVTPAQDFPSDMMPAGAGFVSSCIRLMDSEPEETRAGSDNVHISALVSGDFCPRAHLLMQRYGQAQKQSVLGQMRIVWALGRAAEHHARTQFIRAHGMHRVMGNWHCACGETVVHGKGTSAVCGQCKTPVNRYGELDLSLDGVTGHPDLVFEFMDWIEVVEFKSIKKDSYEKQVKAVPEHEQQCWAYVHILRKTLNTEKVRGRVLYVAKDYISPKVSPYREFMLEDKMPPIMPELFAVAAQVKKHSVEKTLPARLAACPQPTAPRAKNCLACGSCFCH